MNITITSITRPTSCDHYLLRGTVNGVERTLVVNKSDFTLEPDEADDRLIHRIASFIKENNLTTPLAIKNGLEGQSFKL